MEMREPEIRDTISFSPLRIINGAPHTRSSLVKYDTPPLLPKCPLFFYFANMVALLQCMWVWHYCEPGTFLHTNAFKDPIEYMWVWHSSLAHVS